MQTQSTLGGETNLPAQPSVANSILVADCGSVSTKVSLLGLVEGQYRLMARGEAPTIHSGPESDLLNGITKAINEIEFITGRMLIADGKIISPEQEIGDGVDVFVATLSAGDPLRIVVVGGVSAQHAALTAEAVSSLYAETFAMPTPAFVAATNPVPAAMTVGNSGRPSGSGVAGAEWTPDRINAEWERLFEKMRGLHPHIALIVGLADGPAGPAPLQEACQLLVQTSQFFNERQNGTASAGIPGADLPRHKIPVLYAGAPQYVEAVRRMLGNSSEVTRIEPLASQAQLGPISFAANALHEREIVEALPGYDHLRAWSKGAPLGTATSLSSLVRFLAQHYAMNVTAVDIGGSSTVMMLAGEQGEFVPMVNSRAGVGPSSTSVLQRVGWQKIARWLPFNIGEDEIREYTMNRMLHPQVVPTSTRELQIGQAFAREALRLTLEAATTNNTVTFDADLILATGGILAHAPRYGQAVLMLLDALQPKGVTSLVLDRAMLLSQLGVVATVNPIAAVQVNENDGVTHRLGTCVIPFGTMPEGQIAVRVGIEYSDGRQSMIEVMSGSIEVVPLKMNEQALLTLYPAAGVDVGLGPGERARAAEEIDGGLVGLIIDARGRPLVLPTNDMERQARLTQWLQALGA